MDFKSLLVEKNDSQKCLQLMLIWDAEHNLFCPAKLASVSPLLYMHFLWHEDIALNGLSFHQTVLT